MHEIIKTSDNQKQNRRKFFFMTFKRTLFGVVGCRGNKIQFAR